MTSRVAVVILCAFIALPLLAAQKKESEMDKALSQIQAAQSPGEAKAPMQYIVAHADEAPAMHLFLASAAAMGTKDLENAAYLFFAGQMRAFYDSKRYPPKDTGGDSPLVAIGAVKQQLGAEVNPAIMREPKVYARVTERLRSFSPLTPTGYDPGWTHTSANVAEAKQAFIEYQVAYLQSFEGMSALLNDPEYFAAFKVLQDFNFAPYEEQQKPKRVKAREAAEAKMRAIEEKRGIEGVFYKKNE